MAAKPPRTPSYRHHKASGQGSVELNGKQHYLGRFELPETRRKYHQLIAEWEANGRRLPTEPAKTTIVELIAAFMNYATDYYRGADGGQTTTVDHYRQALKPLRDLYSPASVTDFGPRPLKAVRQRMVDSGWARTHVNRQVGRLRTVFKWGVENELVPPSVLHGLQAVRGLPRGRTEARETDPVKSVPQHDVDAIKPHLSRHVKAMVELQLLTGMRPAEVCMMRTRDIDTAAAVWTYAPESHKTQHHGHSRTVYIGPKGQDVLKPFLRHDTTAYLFSPGEAEQERREAQHAARKTPMSCGNKPGSNRRKKPMVEPGAKYDVSSYRRAIHRACDKAFPPPEGMEGEERKQWRSDRRWSPNRLRHNAGTMLRREHGIDLAQTILGHRLGSSVTEVYAEANVAKAIDVVAKIG